jgi:selenocysteine lyase/cysteine desulfurase
LIAEAVNAKVGDRAAEDCVLFVGNGSTGAINKVIASLGLNVPLPPGYDDSHRPIVFTSSYEHHSNLLSWRETVADVVTISYDPITGVSLTDLKARLEKYADRKFKIGSFSAASNVTGILTDTIAVSNLMHRAGGLAFFDYATAAPYVKMDMNPVVKGEDAPYVYKDAIFISGHKFIGGPGCPGVLVAKLHVLPPENYAPTAAGGGTVFFVTDDHQT